MDEQKKKECIYRSFLSLVQHARDMVFIKDTNLAYVIANDAFAHMLGRESAQELLACSDFDLFPEALARKYTENDRRLMAQGNSMIEFIEPLPHKNGRERFVLTTKYLIRDEADVVIGICGISRDVTERFELEAERESSRLSRRMFDDVLEGDISHNRVLRIEARRWIEELDLGRSESLVQAVQRVGSMVHPAHRAEFLARYQLDFLEKNYQRDEFEFSHLTYLCTAREDYHWVHCRSLVYRSLVSDTLRIITFLKDADDEVRDRQQLKERASMDALTGLFNRDAAFEQMTQRLAQPKEDRVHALAFLDLDGFKQVNDQRGHQFGDSVLQSVAERLRAALGPEDIAGRVGGDEFVVLLGAARTEQQVEQMVHKLMRNLDFVYGASEPGISISCSIGVALAMHAGATLDMLYDQADKAMYRAKQAGRNCCIFHR